MFNYNKDIKLNGKLRTTGAELHQGIKPAIALKMMH